MTYFGVCYGPYRNAGWAPPTGPTSASVDADMKLIAGSGFRNVRTYGVTGGNQWNVDKASKYGLTLGLGVEVDNGSFENTKANIVLALNQAQQAATTYGRTISLDLVIGNEVDLEGVPTLLLSNAMAFAKTEKARHPGVAARVTTCLTGTALQNAGSPWQGAVTACEAVTYLTVYPWYAFKAGASAKPNDIDPNMQWSWANGLKQVAALGKQVVIAEIGWPSAGAPQWLTTVRNEHVNYLTTRSWMAGKNFLNKPFDGYWFEMFDEPWKTAEGPWGPHWGLFTSGDNRQQKFQL